MRRLAALAVALSTLASAQVGVTLQPPQPGMLAYQYPDLTLTVINRGTRAVALGRVRGDRIMCPNFKVFRKGGGPALTSPPTDCDIGGPPRLAAGEKRTLKVQMNIPLAPGAYTAVLPVDLEGKVVPARTDLTVGSGPFVAALVLTGSARAGRPLPLAVRFGNVWPTVESRDLRLCGQGLIIRDAKGQVAYDNHPEDRGCTTDFYPTTVKPGATHDEPWGERVVLPAGRYTALMWGQWSAALPFEVK